MCNFLESRSFLVCISQNVFSTLPCWFFLAFFVHFFFSKEKSYSQNEFWLLSFVWGFIPQVFEDSQWCDLCKCLFSSVPCLLGSVIIEAWLICPFMKEYLCLGQRICEFKTLRSTFWFSSKLPLSSVCP